MVGEYRSGATWTLTYQESGRFEQQFHRRPERISGDWRFHGVVFCSVPDLPQFWTGCWMVRRPSANCYEYFRVPVADNRPIAEAPVELDWYGRASRPHEASTCPDLSIA